MKFTSPPIDLPPAEEFPLSLIKKVHNWLGEEGIAFFKSVQKEHGTILAVWDEGGIPHVVHFREGMQVRNYLRMQSECEGWDDHRFDDQWAHVVESALDYSKRSSKMKDALRCIFDSHHP